MKVLLVHNYYTQKGGEDSVFQQESDLLRKHCDVDLFTFQNHGGVRGLFQFLFSIWNVKQAKNLRRKIKKSKPDIIHIHNLHFAAGPLIIRTAKLCNVPVVWTLHNYRLLCPSGILLHNDKIFIHSLTTKFPWYAVLKKVYRNSYLQTFWLGFNTWFHNQIGTWDMVDRYLVLTKFARELFTESNQSLATEKVIVKSNFVGNVYIREILRNNNFLFIGRLSKEKGIIKSLDAFKQTDAELVIAGEGDLKVTIKSVANQFSNITFLGNLDKLGVLNQMRKSSVLIFPSIWFEGMPMTIIEAFATGTPVIANNLGAMSSMVIHGYNGLLFDGSTTDLQNKINYWRSMSLVEKNTLYTGARESYERFYMADKNIEQLIDIYKEVLK